MSHIDFITQSSARNMRILLLSSSYTPVLGGLQTVVHALAQSLSYEHQVQVITNRYPRSLPSREILDGVSVHRWNFLTPAFRDLRRGRTDLFLASLYYYPFTQHRLNRLVRSFVPTVVNVHFPDSQIPFILKLQHHLRFSLVVSLHGDEIERYHQPKATRTYARDEAVKNLCLLLQKADAVTACSQDLMDKAIKLEPTTASKGHIIYNGIAPDRFRDDTTYRHPHPYLLAYGRLTQAKGFDLLLTAFSRLANDYQELHLILAGEGEEREALHNQVATSGLRDRVLFFGSATPRDVVQLLNGARLVIVPSRREPFGIVALEALAAGKRLLATGVGGMGEFLRKVMADALPAQSFHQVALNAAAGSPSPIELVEPSVDGLEVGLRRMLARSALWQEAEMSRVRTYIHENSSWQRTVEQYESVLSTASRGR